MGYALTIYHSYFFAKLCFRIASYCCFLRERLLQVRSHAIYPSSGTKRLFCGRQVNILPDVCFEGRGTMSQTLSQRRMTHRSDRVDAVVLTGQHLPADWHRDAHHMGRNDLMNAHVPRVLCHVWGSEMERHAGCSLTMHGSGKKKGSIR